MKRFYRLAAFVVAFVFSLSVFIVTTFAEGFSLTGIGALDTGGSRYTDWWYTGTNPVLKGTGDSDVKITVDVDGTEYTTNTNSSGNWEIYLELAAGDYSIDIMHDANDSYAFNLHLGQNVPADLGGSVEASESTTAVPITGFNQVVGLSLGAGIVLLGFYFYVANEPKRKAAFEKRFLRD